MFRITNLMPVYEQDETILEYRISVDNGSTDGNSVNANLVVKSTDIDITAIADVCKQKLRETVEQKEWVWRAISGVGVTFMGIASNGDVRVTIGETGTAMFAGSTSYFTADQTP